ncbi:MAG: SLC13 family permease [Peptococcaceae bacterium]
MSNSQTIDKNFIMKWAVVFIAAAAIWFMPCNEVYSPEVKKFLFVTALGILLVAFELMDLMAVSMMFPIGYILFGLAPMDAAYGAWLGTTPMVVIGGYMIANVMDRIGLLKRIAYKCILLVGGSYYGLLFGVLIAGCILNTATGGNAWVIMAAFTFGLCKTFELGKTMDSALIMFVGALSAGASCVFIYTPYFMSILFNSAELAGSTYRPTWIEHFMLMLPYVIFVIALVLILPRIFKPTKKLPGKEFFQQEYAKLGKMSKDEIIGTGFMILLIVFMLTGSIHKMELDWAFILIPWLMFIPGVKVADTEDVKNIDFSMVFFCVACLSIGNVSNHLGIGNMVANLLIPILQPLSSTVVVGAIYVIGLILNFLLTPFAILGGFSEPIAQVAVGLGINPVGALYSLYVGADQVFLPYEYLSYLIFYAFGLMKMTDFIKLATTKSILATLLVFFIMIPWWGFMGIL